MAGVTTECRFVSVSVDQLREELRGLSLAGYGLSMIDFESEDGSWSSAVTMKVYRPIPKDVD